MFRIRNKISKKGSHAGLKTETRYLTDLGGRNDVDHYGSESRFTIKSKINFSVLFIQYFSTILLVKSFSPDRYHLNRLDISNSVHNDI